MSRITRQRGVTIIEAGPSYDSLDEEGLAEFGGALLDEAAHAEPPRLILDLTQTRRIGSRFIELLVRAWKRVKQRGGQMVLCGLHPYCIEVLQVTHLDTLWPTYPTQDEAAAALADP
jgi:anti-sigma B factor antagonist